MDSTATLIGDQLTDHLVFHRDGKKTTEPEPSVIVAGGSLFSTTIYPKTLLTGLAGKSFKLGDSCEIKFPQQVVTSFDRKNQTILFSGQQPKIFVNKLISLEVDVTGFKISLDEVIALLAGFPDFTVRLQW